MKISDIIRSVFGSADTSEISANTTHKRLIPVDFAEPQEEKNPVMVPPLQAKLEIMKKSEGLPNVYEPDSDDAELDLMKSRAGITAVKIETSSDNDLTG